MTLFLLLFLVLVSVILLLIFEHDLISEVDEITLMHENVEQRQSHSIEHSARMKYLKAIQEASSKKHSAVDSSFRNLNIELKQNLNTLIYIFKMESKLRSLNDHDEMNDLLAIRSMLRSKTLRITKDLKSYGSIKELTLEDSFAA